MQANDITPKLQRPQPNVTLEMAERDWDNVKDKTVKEQVAIPKIDFDVINKNIDSYRARSIQYLDLLTEGDKEK